MQRLTVGARVAIKMLSKTGDVEQLRHDFRNGPNHVFGDHHACNPAFCKVALNGSSDSDGGSDSDSDGGNDSNRRDAQQTLTQQLEDIIESKTYGQSNKKQTSANCVHVPYQDGHLLILKRPEGAMLLHYQEFWCVRDRPCFIITSDELSHTGFSGYVTFFCQTSYDFLQTVARTAIEQNPLLYVV